MKLLYGFAQFLISEWIWACTIAWHHLLINVLLMILLFFCVAKIRMIPSVLLSFFSQLFAFVVFTAFVHLVLDKLFGVTFSLYEPPTIIHPLATTFLLGMIYAGLQSLFFYILSFLYRIPLQKFSAIAFLSNGITSFIVYKFLPPL